MAAVVGLYPYHVAGQFKAATGLPQQQYVIARRVQRAKEVLQAGADLSPAEVALRAGFCDQSQFTRHFKRLVSVTPGQFRMPSRIAQKQQVSARDRAARPLLFAQDGGAGLAGDATGRLGGSRSRAFESPFAGSSDGRNERTHRDVSLNPSYALLSTEPSRRDESSCTVE
jgi:AraC-like DNA-binding protein